MEAATRKWFCTWNGDDKGSGESTFYRQKIYYFDDASQTEKVVTTSFGEDNPRFLSIGKSAAMLLAARIGVWKTISGKAARDAADMEVGSKTS